MLKLGSILYEVVRNKRAVLFAGPAGSGKTTIINTYIPPSFKDYVLNPDKYFEPELKKIGGDNANQGAFSPDQLSQAAKAMSKAQKQVKLDYAEAVNRGNPIIMDVTGGSSQATLRKKHELEKQGYAVMMVMVYTTPMTSLKRNSLRDRKLKPSIVLRTWKNVISNIEKYKKDFGENYFILVNNDDDSPAEFSANEVENYFRVNPNYEELSQEEKDVLEQEFRTLIHKVSLEDFVAFDELDSRLKAFLKVDK